MMMARSLLKGPIGAMNTSNGYMGVFGRRFCSATSSEVTDGTGKPQKRQTRNLFEILDTQPNRGISMNFTRSRWLRYDEPCFWNISYAKLRHSPKGFKGKRRAWGVLTWRGQTTGKVERVRRAAKSEWVHVSDELLQQKMNNMKVSESSESSSTKTE